MHARRQRRVLRRIVGQLQVALDLGRALPRRRPAVAERQLVVSGAEFAQGLCVQYIIENDQHASCTPVRFNQKKPGMAAGQKSSRKNMRRRITTRPSSDSSL